MSTKKLYIADSATELHGSGVKVHFQLQFESDAPNAKAILAQALERHSRTLTTVDVDGKFEGSEECIEVSFSASSPLDIKLVLEALAIVESTCVSIESCNKLTTLMQVEKIARACAGWHVHQLLGCALWKYENV